MIEFLIQDRGGDEVISIIKYISNNSIESEASFSKQSFCSYFQLSENNVDYLEIIFKWFSSFGQLCGRLSIDQYNV